MAPNDVFSSFKEHIAALHHVLVPQLYHVLSTIRASSFFFFFNQDIAKDLQHTDSMSL